MSCQHLAAVTLHPPTASQPVYKDDCTQCFDTPDQPWGLDVCLSCFNGGCNSPNRSHSLIHYQLSQHPIVLNIKRTPKPTKAREESPAKIVKLAIAAETEEDTYDTTTVVKCLECAMELDKTLEQLSGAVEGVMNALSSSRQSDVKAWEEEILPCEHTLDMIQGPGKILTAEELEHCAQCNLRENLWFCLYCGNLGCGRGQFGGVGGNSHGLAHFDASHHPVSVKLGSITPYGTADVYCYLCNEERQDPELANHLALWGIKISERQKVEKSLVELQLEQNLKWEFNMKSDDGEESMPLFGPGFTGMKNLGNSCYLASIVQCLFSLPAFAQRYYLPNSDMPLTLQPALDFETQMRKLADGLLSGRYSVPPSSDNIESPYQRGIAPAMFKSLVGKNHAEFSTMRQQDAYEFLLYLLQTVNRTSHQQKTEDPTLSFNFETEQRLQCLGCSRVSYKVEVQDSISVPVPVRRLGSKDVFDTVSLKECLEIFTSPETLEYNCQACGSSAGAVKRTMFKTFPQTLVVNARRFEIIKWVPTKLDIPVDVPDETFSMDEYLSSGVQPGENLLPESIEKPAPKFEPDQALLSVLEGMGFPRVRCEKALYKTGNSDGDVAMNWLFEHMDDADIDEPVVTAEELVSGFEISESSIAMLTDMGFTAAQAKKALKETGADMERAVEWLFSHPDDDVSVTDEAAASNSTPVAAVGDDTLPAMFKLHSVVCHKGGSVHAGHYVAFIRKKLTEDAADTNWVLFNDEKVVKGGEVAEMKKFAYVYFFERQKV
ncbi:hypothetical protein V1512DRAFT_268129 [Lipomyces arxii]|uniref:uncharacterized protein n=1 Tax=Lipomyces arxii TaxID=56418 RepID=UPI0034CE5437